MRVAVGLSVLALAGAVLASVREFRALVDEGPLPPLPNEHCVRDLWPELDLEDLQLGDYEWQAFHDAAARPPLYDWLEPRRCIAFVYNENLLADPPLSLTILVESRKVRGKWLSKTPFDVPECHRLPHQLVDLKGYFHAGFCWGPGFEP